MTDLAITLTDTGSLLQRLRSDFHAAMETLTGDDFTLYITPLQFQLQGKNLAILAPNDFVYDCLKEKYTDAIEAHFRSLIASGKIASYQFGIGSVTEETPIPQTYHAATNSSSLRSQTTIKDDPIDSRVNPLFNFQTFVAGKSNQLARAAAEQVSQNPGAYNPLLIYGGVGLGKTHLMHAVGNALIEQNPNARVLYQSSEGFVGQMVKAIQMNAIDAFKTRYRSLSALLIDDIQFFAGKERSQEEFFHTFNILFDSGQQIILTCDRYPKEIQGLEERLKSRFGWGLAMGVEPPDLETRVAILMSKAEQAEVYLPHDVAFFIAKHVHSNVRELEGALKRLIANAHFTGGELNIAFAKESLKDLIAVYAKLVSIDNIQATVAEYYKIKVSDLLSKRRSRIITRPRQMAMLLAKQLTSQSLPDIGRAFGGRDHTTVLHAVRLMLDLSTKDTIIKEDYDTLMRILSA